MWLASGDPDPHMPNIAEVETSEPRMTSNGALRTRKRRDDLVLVLEELAYNLRWSWDPATVDLFHAIAPEPWTRTHNPVAVVRAADPDVLAEHAESILERRADLEQYLNRPAGVENMPRIGYFCA